MGWGPRVLSSHAPHLQPERVQCCSRVVASSVDEVYLGRCRGMRARICALTRTQSLHRRSVLNSAISRQIRQVPFAFPLARKPSFTLNMVTLLLQARPECAGRSVDSKMNVGPASTESAEDGEGGKYPSTARRRDAISM